MVQRQTGACGYVRAVGFPSLPGSPGWRGKFYHSRRSGATYQKALKSLENWKRRYVPSWFALPPLARPRIRHAAPVRPGSASALGLEISIGHHHLSAWGRRPCRGSVKLSAPTPRHSGRRAVMRDVGALFALCARLSSPCPPRPAWMRFRTASGTFGRAICIMWWRESSNAASSSGMIATGPTSWPASSRSRRPEPSPSTPGRTSPTMPTC